MHHGEFQSHTWIPTCLKENHWADPDPIWRKKSTCATRFFDGIEHFSRHLLLKKGRIKATSPSRIYSIPFSQLALSCQREKLCSCTHLTPTHTLLLLPLGHILPAARDRRPTSYLSAAMVCAGAEIGQCHCNVIYCFVAWCQSLYLFPDPFYFSFLRYIGVARVCREYVSWPARNIRPFRHSVLP